MPLFKLTLLDSTLFSIEEYVDPHTKIREKRYMFNDEYSFGLEDLKGLLAYLKESDITAYNELVGSHDPASKLCALTSSRR